MAGLYYHMVTIYTAAKEAPCHKAGDRANPTITTGMQNEPPTASADRTMNETVTIIIPTHFRHAYLNRVLEQYADTGIPVLVADSTATPFEPAKKYQNVTYHHWPEKNLIQKLHAAIQSVSTPCAVMRADNRHTVPMAITQCADFLADNPDHSICHGAYVAVERFGDNLSARPNYHSDGHRGVTGDTATARIMEVWDNYIPAFYAVSRTDCWKRVLDIAITGITNSNALEVLDSLLMAVEGKSRRLPVFYGAIQIANRVSAKSATYDGFDVVAGDSRYAKEYAHLIDSAATRLAELESMDQAGAVHLITASVKHHLERCCAHQPRRTFIQKLPKYLKRAVSVFDTNREKRFLDERNRAINEFLAPLDPSSRDNFQAMMAWLDSWKDEI